MEHPKIGFSVLLQTKGYQTHLKHNESTFLKSQQMRFVKVHHLQSSWISAKRGRQLGQRGPGFDSPFSAGGGGGGGGAGRQLLTQEEVCLNMMRGDPSKAAFF